MTMIPLQANGCIGHKLSHDHVSNNNYSSSLHPLPKELPDLKYYYHTSDSDLYTDDDFEDYDDDEVIEDDSNPSQLLEFVATVTNDINLFIQRNKGNEDYCDVYEERFRTSLSGQELYYTDLLELANSNTNRNSKGNRSTASSGLSSPNRVSINPENRMYTYGVSSENGSYQQLCFNGQCVSDSGLGPLDELFKKPFKSNKNSELRNEKNVLPMTMRKLPVSFWQEPGLTSKDSVDFSDLFTQWSNEKC